MVPSFPSSIGDSTWFSHLESSDFIYLLGAEGDWFTFSLFLSPFILLSIVKTEGQRERARSPPSRSLPR